MSEQDSSSEAHVLKWLEESGTALELRTAREFRQASYDVTHARYYVTDDGETLRESDVVAVIRGRVASPAISLHFVVECKSGSAPWVLYESDTVYLRQDQDLLRTFTLREFGGARAENLQRLYAAPVLFSTEPNAYQIADTSKKKNDAAYSAMRQVMAGVAGLVRDVPEIDQPALLIFVPVLVTSAPLYRVGLDPTGEPKATRVSRMLLVTRQRPEDQFRSMWVLHENAVADFVRDARASADALSCG